VKHLYKNFLILLLSLSGALAQNATTVSGTVLDQTGAAVSSSRLTLIGKGSQQSRQVFSDGEGRFLFNSVPPGQYVLKAKTEDFESVSKEITVTARPVAVNLEMKISVAEQITVTSTGSDPVAPEKNLDAVRLGEESLHALPSDSQNILQILGNFVAPAAGGTEGLSLVVDGVEAGDIADLPSSSLRTMVIDRNPYAAEFRRPGKARVEVTTRQGSLKRYHGSVALFARNSVFDSRNAFAAEKPDLDRRLVQAALGGPLGLKGASFFLSGQHLGNRENAIVNAVTLTGPLVVNVPTTVGRDDILGRIDLHPGSTHSLTAFYSFDQKFQSNQGVGGFNLADQAFATALRAHKFQFSDQAVVRPDLLNTLRVLVRRSSSGQGIPPAGPGIVVNGAFNSGSAQTASRSRETLVEAEDVAAYARHRHTLHFGADARTRFFNVSDFTNFGGTFEFASLSQFQSGTPYVFRINQGRPIASFSIQEAGGFVQDEIRVRPSLVLDLGVRHDWQSSLPNRKGIAPRLAVSYAPGDQKTVIRAGAGVFYERLTEVAQQQARLLDGVRVMQLVIPNPTFPAIPNLTVSSVPTSIVRLAPNITSPYLVQASLGLERELWSKGHLTVEYQMLRGIHLFRSHNINAPLPLTGLRPNPNFLNINQVESTARMRSHAVTATFTGRAGKYLTGTAQYTFSRAINDTSGALSLPADNYNLASEMGRADFDRRHRFSYTSLLNTPSGFRLGAILTLGSGIPFNITAGQDNNHDTLANDRPQGVTRNTGRGPGLVQLDLRLTKLFRVPRPLNRDLASRNLEISLDAFNVVNHTNFVNFVGVLTSPFFGRANAALPARTLQLSFNYRF